MRLAVANLIREFFSRYPEGADRDRIYYYCLDNGATFDNQDVREQKKSVSAQLSSMRARGELELVGRIWRPARRETAGPSGPAQERWFLDGGEGVQGTDPALAPRPDSSDDAEQAVWEYEKGRAGRPPIRTVERPQAPGYTFDSMDRHILVRKVDRSKRWLELNARETTALLNDEDFWLYLYENGTLYAIPRNDLLAMAQFELHARLGGPAPRSRWRVGNEE